MEAQQYLRQEARISELLEPGENILWQGRPDRRAFLLYRVIFASVGIFWAIFQLAFLDLPLRWSFYVSFNQVIFPMLVIIYCSWFIIKRIRQWRGIGYFITNQRLLVIDLTLPVAYLSLPLEKVTSSRLESAWEDGVGKLVFESQDDNGYLEFSGIKEDEEVLQIVEQAREKRLAALGKSAES